MLQRAHRLAGEKEFSRIFKKGRSFHGNGVSVRVVRNGGAESRFAFVVSTKVSKKAVKRNAVRRRLREVVRLVMPRIDKGWDVAVMTRPEILKLSPAQQREEMHRVLQKARLLP